MKNNGMMKKIATVLLVCSMVFFSSVPASAESGTKPVAFDIKGHWAEEIITQWIEKELVHCYADRSFRPNNAITRAEFITLLNNAINLPEGQELNFRDVKETDWFSKDFASAVTAGYLSGYTDHTLRPDHPITREESAVVIAKMLDLDDTETEEVYQSVKDSEKIGGWSREMLGAVLENGYLSGYSDGTVKPKQSITRAEALVMMDRAIGLLIETPGIYGTEEKEIIKGNVTISSGDVTLRNMEISGNLFLTEGIGSGTVTLDHVIVRGTKLVKGGEEKTIETDSDTVIKSGGSSGGSSSGSSGGSSVEVPVLTTVTLSSDKGEAEPEEVAVFSLGFADQNGNPIAAPPGEPVYTVLDSDHGDGEVQDNPAIVTLEGSQATFHALGNYKVSATVGGIQSNTLSVAVVYDLTGSGIGADPYVINTLTGLEKIGTGSYGMDAFYELGRDIDASPTNDGGQGWQPISGEFSGSFDGKNHSINGLYINRPDADNVGLFSTVSGAINQLNLTDVDITGNGNVGAIAGIIIIHGSISSCSSDGEVSGNGNNTGGLAGVNYGGSIDACHTGGTISGGASKLRAGGIVGYCNSIYDVVFAASTTVTNSYSTASVSGYRSIGGIAGGMNYSTVTDCFALTPGLTGSYDLGRITGGKGNSPTLNGNYARYDMTSSRQDAFTEKTLNGKDGKDLYAWNVSGSSLLLPVSICSSLELINGTDNPTFDMELYWDTFNSDGTESNASNWSINTGSTGLSLTGISRLNDTHVSIAFNGRAGEGTINIQALAGALSGTDDSTAWAVTVPAVDKTELESKISDAIAIKNNTPMGTDPYEAPESAHITFANAISAAESVRDDANATQVQVNAAVMALDAAITEFESKVIPDPLGAG